MVKVTMAGPPRGRGRSAPRDGSASPVGGGGGIDTRGAGATAAGSEMTTSEGGAGAGGAGPGEAGAGGYTLGACGGRLTGLAGGRWTDSTATSSSGGSPR